MWGVLWLGASAGLLNTCMFLAISSLYERDRATTVNLAGVLFGLGCLADGAAGGRHLLCVHVPGILILLATLPGCMPCFCARPNCVAVPRRSGSIFASAARTQQSRRGLVQSAAVLSIRQRMVDRGLAVAVSYPASWNQPAGVVADVGAVLGCVLLVGRMLSQLMLREDEPDADADGSIVSSLLGAVVLASTNNRFGAL